MHQSPSPRLDCDFFNQQKSHCRSNVCFWEGKDKPPLLVSGIHIAGIEKQNLLAYRWQIHAAEADSEKPPARGFSNLYLFTILSSGKCNASCRANSHLPFPLPERKGSATFCRQSAQSLSGSTARSLTGAHTVHVKNSQFFHSFNSTLLSKYSKSSPVSRTCNYTQT